MPEYVLTERLNRLGRYAYGDERDQMWTIRFAYFWIRDAHTLLVGKSKRRTYLARYAPGYTPEELGNMTSAELTQAVANTSEIIRHENGSKSDE